MSLPTKKDIRRARRDAKELGHILAKGYILDSRYVAMCQLCASAIEVFGDRKAIYTIEQCKENRNALDVVIQQSKGIVKTALEMVCPRCSARLCYVEPGNTLGFLYAAAIEHEARCSHDGGSRE
jgi:hypothetical protein